MNKQNFDIIWYIGKLINRHEIWRKNLRDLKSYIDKYGKRPSSTSDNSIIKSLGIWTINQDHSYIPRNFIMSDDNIYNEWTDMINDERYKKYFLSDSIIISIW